MAGIELAATNQQLPANATDEQAQAFLATILAGTVAAPETEKEGTFSLASLPPWAPWVAGVVLLLLVLK